MTAGTQNGMPQSLKTNSYNTKTTRYIRNAEPNNRDKRKNAAPVFSDLGPNASQGRNRWRSN